jgi:hypothetical protein
MRYILPAVVLIALSSCGIYRQNVANAPLMKEKGEAQLSGHISFSGPEAQSAYALTNSVALLGNYNNMGTRNTDGGYAQDRHNFKELGAGFFKKNKRGAPEEIFLLVGKGMTSHALLKPDSTGRLQHQKVNYNRFVIQGDYGAVKKKFEYDFSPRIAAVHYNHIVDNTRTDYRALGNFHVYLEGAATLRYSFLQHLNASAQAFVTLPVIRSGVGYDYYYDFAPFNLSFGLIYDMNVLKGFR